MILWKKINVKEVVGKYESLGKAIGALVDEKNLQYGDAFNRGGCILESGQR